MIIEIDADLLVHPLDAIGHFCNCQNTMGGGLAAGVRLFYPDAYLADSRTKAGDINKLGSFSYARKDGALTGKLILNLYTQFWYGRDQRHTNYEMVHRALTAAEAFLSKTEGVNTFGLPKNAGCALGGGSWSIVKPIIEDVFVNSRLHLYICNYTP